MPGATKPMKAIKSLLIAGVILVTGLMAPVCYGQTFTFSTIAGGTQGSNDGVDTNAQFF